MATSNRSNVTRIFRVPKAGDLVWLKSGSPRMVVDGIIDPRDPEAKLTYICHWLTKTGRRETGYFHGASLVFADPADDLIGA